MKPGKPYFNLIEPLSVIRPLCSITCTSAKYWPQNALRCFVPAPPHLRVQRRLKQAFIMCWCNARSVWLYFRQFILVRNDHLYRNYATLYQTSLQDYSSIRNTRQICIQVHLHVRLILGQSKEKHPYAKYLTTKWNIIMWEHPTAINSLNQHFYINNRSPVFPCVYD